MRERTISAMIHGFKCFSLLPVCCQCIVSVLSDDDNIRGLIFRVENEKYSCQCIVSYADHRKIMPVCCQSVVSVLSDADNRLTILPVYRQKGRFSRQPVVSLLSVCCQM